MLDVNLIALFSVTIWTFSAIPPSGSYSPPMTRATVSWEKDRSTEEDSRRRSKTAADDDDEDMVDRDLSFSGLPARKRSRDRVEWGWGVTFQGEGGGRRRNLLSGGHTAACNHLI